MKTDISSLWDIRKVRSNTDPCPTQLPSQFPAGDPRDATVIEAQRRIGKFGKFSHLSHPVEVT